MFDDKLMGVTPFRYLPDCFCPDIDGGEDAWRRFNQRDSGGLVGCRRDRRIPTWLLEEHRPKLCFIRHYRGHGSRRSSELRGCQPKGGRLSFAAAKFDARRGHREPDWSGGVVIVLGILLLVLG